MQNVKQLYEQVLRQFPEVASYISDGDEELPYLVVGSIVDWLMSVAKPAIDPAIVQRVVDFDRWCMQQPRRETAADDIKTIEVVALREKLFEHDALLPIVSKLYSREELLQAREYLTSWVGTDRFQAALRLSH